MEQKSKETWLGAAVLAIIFMVGLSTCGESDDEKKQKAARFSALPFDQKVKSLSGSIVEVTEASKGEILQITYYKSSIWDGENWTWNFFGTAKAVLSKINDLDPAVQYQQVVFMVRYPTRDSLGREGDALGMKVLYRMSDLHGAKWDAMYESDLANLASDIQFKGDGLVMAYEYCTKGASKPPIFCKRVLNAMVRRASIQ